jgi:hypothetical protein
VSAPTTPNARCPRCGAAFRCGVDDAAPCACSAVELDARIQGELRSRYAGCLCVDCLRALAAGEAVEHRIAPPAG